MTEIRGEALALTVAAGPEVGTWNPQPGSYDAWPGETRLLVGTPGSPPAQVRSRREMTRAKYLVPGLRFPVTVSAGRVRVEWDEIPTIDELIARADPLFTDPDATRALLEEAGLRQPTPETIDGPNARVISFGDDGPGTSRNHKVDVLLSVALPGRPRFGYRWQGKAPRDRVLRPGMNIAVTPGPSGQIDIPWSTPRPLGRRFASAFGVDLDALQSVRASFGPAGAMQRLALTGIELPAAIRAFSPGPLAGGARHVQFQVEVEPSSGRPYPAAFGQTLPEAVVATLAVGQRVTVKVAREDPRVVMLWNIPQAPGGVDPDTGRPLSAAAGDERAARLHALEDLRASGWISEPDYQARRAQLLDVT